MAGPCPWNPRSDFCRGESISRSGASFCAVAPSARSSPYSFKDGEEALKLMRKPRTSTAAGGQRGHGDLPIPLMLLTSICSRWARRNMQNFNLLRELGKVRKPVLLKRALRHH